MILAALVAGGEAVQCGGPCGMAAPLTSLTSDRGKGEGKEGAVASQSLNQHVPADLKISC